MDAATTSERAPREGTGDPEEAARLRAAFAYARLSKKARAAALGVHERSVSRYESAQTPVPPGAWPKVLEATGLPAWFAAANFELEPDEPKLSERVEALERQVRTLLGRDPGEVRPSVTDRAREASRRLDGTQPTSPRSSAAGDDAGEAR